MRLKINKPLVGGGRGGANKEITRLFIIAVDWNAFMYMLATANGSRSAELRVACHLALRPCLIAVATFLDVIKDWSPTRQKSPSINELENYFACTMFLNRDLFLINFVS